MQTVRMPAPFQHYACQRSLVCCHHPLRAPIEEEEEAHITKVLASTDPGRARLPIFQAGFERMEGIRVYKHVDDRCVHLVVPPEDDDHDHEPGGCALHYIGGLDILGTACRNYPRMVTSLPEAEGSTVQMEVLFSPSCPTAASLLVKDPAPFRFVEVPLDTWIYPPTRAANTTGVRLMTALRSQWWRVLADGREDTERLLAVLDAIWNDPYEPPASEPTRGEVSPEILRGPQSIEVDHVHAALERIPKRGRTYATHHWDLRRDLTVDLTQRQLLDMLDIAPELLVAFLDHLVPFAGLHDPRPVHHCLRAAVRRTIAVARMADSLLSCVPYGINTLFGDLITAAMHLDATAATTDSSSSVALDKGVR